MKRWDGGDKIAAGTNARLCSAPRADPHAVCVVTDNQLDQAAYLRGSEANLGKIISSSNRVGLENPREAVIQQGTGMAIMIDGGAWSCL